jgi:hypothetical protein
VEGLDPFVKNCLATGREMDDVRLVLIRSLFRTDQADVYYLHWDDGRNLHGLDQRVEDGAHTDGDFIHSAKTVYSKTRCPACQLRWDTLIMPPGDPYLGAPGLLYAKIRGHRLERCANCGASLRQLVVKIFSANCDQTPGSR